MNKPRRTLLAVLTAALTVSLMMVAPQSATAATTSPLRTVYAHVSYCVQGQAGIDYYNGGFSSNHAYARAAVAGRHFTGACNLPWTGQARARLDVQVWNGAAWVFCRGSGWAVGPVGWVGGDFPGPTGPVAWLDYGGSASCGSGYYRTVAFAEYNTAPSTWVGGSVTSPELFVP